MWIGALLGLFYCVTLFRGEGVPPRVRLNCGPFKNGHIVLCGKHVHHWMIAIPFAAVSLVIGAYNLFGFCVIMFGHGLLYTDRCNMSVRDNSGVIDVDVESESFEEEEEEEENAVLDILGDPPAV